MTGPKREIEDAAFVAFTRRILRALGRRAAISDPYTIAELLELTNELERVAADAMIRLNALPEGQRFSWAEIAAPRPKDPRAVQRWAERHTTIEHGHDDPTEPAEMGAVA